MSQSNGNSFTVTLEPHGGCNLQCHYCYSHINNARIMGIDAVTRLTDKIAHHINEKGFKELSFVWQGGEPLLAGIAFFRKAVKTLKSSIPRVQQRHFIQTNGLLLDDEFCRFFRDMNVQVGVSLDGPQGIHDQMRVDSKGEGTYVAVIEKIYLLEKHQVPVGFNAVISKASLGNEQRLYSFFQEMGYGFRVNPIIPPLNRGIADEYLLRKGEYGTFLCRLFDVWTRTEGNRIDVSPLDAYLLAVSSGQTSECQHKQTCVGSNLGIKPTGEAVLCSRFQSHVLGNIMQMPVAGLFSSSANKGFKDRLDALSDCRSCENWSICNGGCPANSVACGQALKSKDPFCPDYKIIFEHIRSVLKNANLKAAKDVKA